MTLDLSTDEATVLLNFVHIAVQAKGLQVASDAAFLAKKIQAAAAASEALLQNSKADDDNVVDIPRAKEA
jgi:hypothetical protein